MPFGWTQISVHPKVGLSTDNSQDLVAYCKDSQTLRRGFHTECESCALSAMSAPHPSLFASGPSGFLGHELRFFTARGRNRCYKLQEHAVVLSCGRQLSI